MHLISLNSYDTLQTVSVSMQGWVESLPSTHEVLNSIPETEHASLPSEGRIPRQSPTERKWLSVEGSFGGQDHNDSLVWFPLQEHGWQGFLVTAD